MDTQTDCSIDVFVYAIRHRFALFPVTAGEKTPLIKWKTQSSHDPNQWRAWREEFPNCNFGIDAARSGLIFLDKDVGRVGEVVATLEMIKLFSLWGLLLPDPHCRTQSNGMHYYFQRPDNCPAPDLMKGIHKLAVDANGH